jgi:hypothetical protein
MSCHIAEMWSISARNCTFDRIYERKLSVFLRMRMFLRKFLRMFLRTCILVETCIYNVTALIE